MFFQRKRAFLGFLILVVFTPLSTQAMQAAAETKLTASDAAAGDGFGVTAAIEGDTVVVGASGDDVGGMVNSGSGYVFTFDGVSWNEIAKLIPGDATANVSFGDIVDISGNTVVVGNFRKDDVGSNSGAAYIFERDENGPDNWGEVKKLIASDIEAGDFFGFYVTVSGDTVIVGANSNDDACLAVPNPNCNSGAAYIFERDFGGLGNWGESKKLIASDASEGDVFGCSVAIDGATVVVGACRVEVMGDSEAGAVYIFERDFGGAGNWGEVKKLTASDGTSGDPFGFTLDISGDTIVVTSQLADGGAGPLSGAAYVFERDGGNWGEVKKLTPSDAAENDRFGFNNPVAIEDDRIAVGALGNDDACLPAVKPFCESGSAYVFARDAGGIENWGLVNKILPSDSEEGDIFGLPLGISGNRLVVGSLFDDDACPADPNCDSGSVYIFDPRLVQVDLDIKPGSFPNSINPSSTRVLPVAILGTETFDATTVDPASVRFGPNGAGIAHAHGHIEDVDGDGDDDLVLHFQTQETGIACGEMEAGLTGTTFGGQSIQATDSIATVGGSCQ